MYGSICLKSIGELMEKHGYSIEESVGLRSSMLTVLKDENPIGILKSDESGVYLATRDIYPIGRSHTTHDERRGFLDCLSYYLEKEFYEENERPVKEIMKSGLTILDKFCLWINGRNKMSPSELQEFYKEKGIRYDIRTLIDSIAVGNGIRGKNEKLFFNKTIGCTENTSPRLFRPR